MLNLDKQKKPTPACKPSGCEKTQMKSLRIVYTEKDIGRYPNKKKITLVFSQAAVGGKPIATLYKF